MPGVPDKVVLHPLVLLSVVDHYNRVARDTKKRVVGVLLGETFKGQVDVTNSFAGGMVSPATYRAAVVDTQQSHEWAWSSIPVSLLTVPFEEDDKDPSIWFLDHSYLEQMFRMFKKVNGEPEQEPSGAKQCNSQQSQHQHALHVYAAAQQQPLTPADSAFNLQFGATGHWHGLASSAASATAEFGYFFIPEGVAKVTACGCACHTNSPA